MATKTAESNELLTPTDLPRKGAAQVGEELRHLLADFFALYLKTKNFHWHMSGPPDPRESSAAAQFAGVLSH
jgi:starvation-inducible DNA-binding protein